jgi:hypothetical protein
VVEGARLESVYRGNSIAGSNPALSAIFSCKYLICLTFSAALFSSPTRMLWWAHGKFEGTPPIDVPGVEPAAIRVCLFQALQIQSAHDVLSGKRPTAVRMSWRSNPHPLISASSH